LIETPLKVLYTAVTRCIEQLVFVETAASPSGDAAVRFLTTNKTAKKAADSGDVLTTRSYVEDVEAVATTSDEWVSVGIENAEMTETADVDLFRVATMLERSVYRFEQAKNLELASKARTHRLGAQ
jgi:hypothetical protein